MLTDIVTGKKVTGNIHCLSKWLMSRETLFGAIPQCQESLNSKSSSYVSINKLIIYENKYILTFRLYMLGINQNENVSNETEYNVKKEFARNK